MGKINVYHGSYCKVENPSFDNGRIDADFGIGFYVTAKPVMAEKWACRKNKQVVNEYCLDTDSLKIHTFGLDKEWLDFVIQNRNGAETDFSAGEYDLIIGTTADDRLFSTIEQYERGFIDTETAIKALNCINVGQQICIKTQKGLDNLEFVRCTGMSPERVAELRELNRKERITANNLTGEIIRSHNIEKSRKCALENIKTFPPKKKKSRSR